MSQQYFQRLSSRCKTLKEETPPCVEYGSACTMNLAGNHNSAQDTAQVREDFEAAVDVKKIGKELEDYMKSRRLAFEERMFEKFYVMRIEQSRRFIDLIRKINKSWDDFVEYLKVIGSQGASGDGDCSVYSLTNSSSLTGVSQVSNDSKG